MNGHYDPYYGSGDDGGGLRGARSGRSLVAGPPSLMGDEHRGPTRRNLGDYIQGEQRSSLLTTTAISPSDDECRFPGRVQRSVSPDSFGSHGEDSFGSAGTDESPIPTAKPPPPSFHSSRVPGAYSASHDAVSRKVAEFDNHRPQGVKQIEIAPGIWARLRGAKETWSAVENDFFMPTTCFCCTTDIFCIMDANYVICPVCKVVSPMEGCAKPGGFDGGVGLGFTMDDLLKWQGEILEKQRKQRLQQQQHFHHPGW